MRQGIGLVLLLVLLLVGAGIFVVTAVSLRSSITASAATLSVQPSENASAAMAAPADQTQPIDASTTQYMIDDGEQDVTFSRAAHQGYCDGDKETSSVGY